MNLKFLLWPRNWHSLRVTNKINQSIKFNRLNKISWMDCSNSNKLSPCKHKVHRVSARPKSRTRIKPFNKNQIWRIRVWCNKSLILKEWLRKFRNIFKIKLKFKILKIHVQLHPLLWKPVRTLIRLQFLTNRLSDLLRRNKCKMSNNNNSKLNIINNPQTVL